MIIKYSDCLIWLITSSHIKHIQYPVLVVSDYIFLDSWYLLDNKVDFISNSCGLITAVSLLVMITLLIFLLVKIKSFSHDWLKYINLFYQSPQKSTVTFCPSGKGQIYLTKYCTIRVSSNPIQVSIKFMSHYYVC